MMLHPSRSSFFFFNDTATTEIYTLSLHDALPISVSTKPALAGIQDLAGNILKPNDQSGATKFVVTLADLPVRVTTNLDRKSTRLNSSHSQISYAVFCLKKKKNCNSSIRASRCT